MHNLSADLRAQTQRVQKMLSAGDFSRASERLAGCLIAFQEHRRTLEEVATYREWLSRTIDSVRIARQHLSHEKASTLSSNYRRQPDTPLWSITA